LLEAVVADIQGVLKGRSKIQVDLVETVILRREALTGIYNSDLYLTDPEKKQCVSAIDDRYADSWSFRFGPSVIVFKSHYV
jgi:hypothetical protein